MIRSYKRLYQTEAMKQMLRAGYDRRKAYKMLVQAINSDSFGKTTPDEIKVGDFCIHLFIFSDTKQGHNFWWKLCGCDN